MTAVCLNNNSQINKALIIYTTDSSGFTPSNTYNGHITNSVRPAHGWVGEKTPGHSSNYRSLNIYLGAADGRSDVNLPVAKCPLDDYANGGRSGDSNFAKDGHSYIGNARDYGGLNNVKNGISISVIRDSSRMVSLPEFGAWHIANGFGQSWGYSWHGKFKYTLGFLDGHVRNMKLNSGIKSGNDYTFP